MNENQQAAYIHSQASAALIEAMGMISENQQRLANGCSIAYDHAAFLGLIEHYGLHHNAVMHAFTAWGG